MKKAAYRMVRSLFLRRGCSEELRIFFPRRRKLGKKGDDLMKQEKKIDYHEHDTPDREEYPDLSNVASANECTGLMYKVPLDNGELESYQRLSPMAVPRGEQDMRESVQYKLHRSKDAKEAGEAVEDASDGCYSARHPE